jgi:hypothetical protein
LGTTILGVIVLAALVYLAIRLMKQPAKEIADEIKHAKSE